MTTITYFANPHWLGRYTPWLLTGLFLWLAGSVGWGAPVASERLYGGFEVSKDANGNIVASVDSTGQTALYSYDAENRLTDIKLGEASPITLGYNVSGNLTSLQDGLGRVEYAYDVHGRLAKATTSNNHVWHYQWDDHGRLTGLRSSSGDWLQLNYDAEDNLVSRSGSDGLQVSFKYDQQQRPVLAALQGPKGSSTLRFSFDQAGNLVGLGRSETSGLKESLSFQYDNVDRLVAIADNQQERLSLTYQSDGNIRTARSPGSGLITFEHKSGLLASIDTEQGRHHLSYDPMGRLQAYRAADGNTTTYYWQHNQLSQIKEQRSTFSLAYGGFGDFSHCVEEESLGRTPNPVQTPRQPISHSRLLIQDPLEYVVSDQLPAIARSLIKQTLKEGFKQLSNRPDQRVLLGPTLDVSSHQFEYRMAWLNRKPGRIIGHTGKGLLTAYTWYDAVSAASDRLADQNSIAGAVQLSKPIVSSLVSKAVGQGLVAGGTGAGVAAAGAPILPAVIAAAATGFAVSQVYTMADLGIQIGTANWKNNRRMQEVDQLRIRGLDALSAGGKGVVEMQDHLRRTGMSEAEMSSYAPLLNYKESALLRNDSAFLGDSRNNRQTKSCTSPAYPFEFPGGGSVGGVNLKSVVNLIGDLGGIKGAYLNPDKSELVLYGPEPGKGIGTLKTDPADFFIAFKTIAAGQEPSISIEPINPGLQDGKMKVLYNGRFKMGGKGDWVRFNEDGVLMKALPPTTFGHPFGNLMFTNDVWLKQASLGRNNEDPAKPFQTRIAGYRSELDHLVALHSNDGSNRNVRVWLEPDPIEIKRSADGRSIEIQPIRIRAQARSVDFTPQGRMQDDQMRIPAATRQWLDFINANMEALSEEFTPLRRLQSMAVAVALARWLYGAGVPIDSSWLDSLDRAETPLTVPAVCVRATNETSIVSLYGGVGFSDNAYTVETKTRGVAAKIKAQRPSPEVLKWTIPGGGGGNDQAVALKLKPSLTRGAFTLLRDDLELGFDILRRYSSVEQRKSALGTGWSFDLPRLSLSQRRVEEKSCLTILTIEDCSSRAELVLSSDGLFRSHTGRFREAGIVVRGQRFQPVSVPGFVHTYDAATGAIMVTRGERPVGYEGYAAQTLAGDIYFFDPSGFLRGIKRADGETLLLNYTDRMLTSVEAPSRRSSFVYRGGFLTEVHSANRRVEFEYNQGRLRAVRRDGKVLEAYGYDQNGHLDTLFNNKGLPIARMTYHDSGRLLLMENGGRTATVTYQGEDRIKYVFDDKSFVEVSYDASNRVTCLTVPGKQASFHYDNSGNLVGTADGNGHLTLQQWDSNGHLEAKTSPMGGVTRFLNYGPHGLPEMLVDPSGQITFLHYDQTGTIQSMETGFKLDSEKPGRFVYHTIAPRTTRIGGK